MHRQNTGVALLMITVSVILMSIGLTYYLPRAELEVKRDKEDSLRFYLGELNRAVEKYKIANDSLPESLETLLKDNQGRPFLRKAYLDPFTGKFDWQFKKGSGTVLIHSSSDKISISGVAYSKFR